MSKVKVLTIQFDVTHLNQAAIDTLLTAASVQGESIPVWDADADFCTGFESADILNTSVREVDVDDV